MSLIIDAKEGRNVATKDIVGAYLLTDIEDYALAKLTGKIIGIMRGVDEKYRSYVGMEVGKKVLYLQLHKVLYGYI